VAGNVGPAAESAPPGHKTLECYGAPHPLRLDHG
jgi:hypothetical protein